MADDLGEKTEQPTGKRLEDARQRGQVAKSQDLSSAVMLVVGTLALALLVTWMLGEGTKVLGYVLAPPIMADLKPTTASDTVAFVGMAALRIVAPILLVLWMAGFVAEFSQVGVLFSLKAVSPQLNKLSPIAGFQRLFGLSSLVKAGLNSGKVLVVAIVAVLSIQTWRDEILHLAYVSVLEALATIGYLMFKLALRLLLVLLALGVVDFAYQKWKRSQDLRMSKQEVRDEMKQMEGDPHVKRRRMSQQQQIAMQRISSAVPKADVIVTNPEHISIAIRYDQERMNAPTVVAKGADHLAMRIRQIAMQHGIPIVERKPLARALYRQVAVGQEVPPDFYQAIAEVLAYVYRLSGAA